MAAKKVKIKLKLILNAGTATPAPPVGPALGQHGVATVEFVNKYNEATKEMRGQKVPVEITIYEDRSFTFVLKTAPVSELIKQTIKIEKGAGNVKKEVAGTLSMDQVKAIAEKKMNDLNTKNLQSAMNSVMGTARSMGVKVTK
jgi:large subunit ribosomal protein L11